MNIQLRRVALTALFVFVVATTLSAAVLNPGGQPVYNGFLPVPYLYTQSTPQAALDMQFPQALTFGYQSPSLSGGVVDLTGYQLRLNSPQLQPIITTPAISYAFTNLTPSASASFQSLPGAPIDIPAATLGNQGSAVPEPGSMAIAGLGLLMISFGIRRRR